MSERQDPPEALEADGDNICLQRENSSAQSQQSRNGIYPRSPAERVAANLRDGPNGCKEWVGALDAKGYARVSVGGQRNHMAHRVAWEAVNGPIPAGLTIDHLCRNRRCCNVAHLEAITAAENTRRSWAHRAPKTHCKRGHEFTAENTMELTSARRRCRTCKEAWQRQARENAR